MKPMLLLTAPVATRSGYGSHSRDLARSLIDMDLFDIKINSMKWGNTPMNALSANDEEDKKIIDRILKEPQTERQPEVHIQVSVPNEFSPLAKYNIGITAGIECTAPKPEWIEGMNRMNMNIVPSNFAKTIFTKVVYEKMDERTKQKVGEVKLEKPIEVLFEGADTEVYKKTKSFSTDLLEQMSVVETSWNFLFVGHWLQGDVGHDRKDLAMLIKVFLETFKNRETAPGLILKTSSATFSVMDRRQILEKIKFIKDGIKQSVNVKNFPDIYLLHGDLEDEEMNQLYNHPKVKAHVSLTHGEGFGRPLLEATLSEKPIIVSNWSGHTDFLNKKQSILLPGVETEVHKSSLPKDMLVEGAKWFTVNYQQAARYMMHVYKNHKKYSLLTKKLAITNRAKFSLNNMTKEFEKILEKYLPKFEEAPKAVNLTLPKLKKVGDGKKPAKVILPKLKRV
jgi:glycosyltransferase involved in cell wall biosynthesis